MNVCRQACADTPNIHTHIYICIYVYVDQYIPPTGADAILTPPSANNQIQGFSPEFLAHKSILAITCHAYYSSLSLLSILPPQKVSSTNVEPATHNVPATHPPSESHWTVNLISRTLHALGQQGGAFQQVRQQPNPSRKSKGLKAHKS